METVSELKLPRIGIGCNAFGARVDADRVAEIVDAAIEHGAAFFDTADVYGFGSSEELLGAAIKGRRDSVIVATKFGMDVQGINGPDSVIEGGRRGSAAYVRASVEASLRRLQTDYIDLYQMHRPDDRVDLEETLSALTDLVRQGKVRMIGHSAYPAERIVEAQWVSEKMGLARFRCEQAPY